MAVFSDRVELEDVVCLSQTEKAIWIRYEGREYAIPQSQIDDDSEVYKSGQRGTLIISEWFAIKKGLC